MDRIIFPLFDAFPVFLVEAFYEISFNMAFKLTDLKANDRFKMFQP